MPGPADRSVNAPQLPGGQPHGPSSSHRTGATPRLPLGRLLLLLFAGISLLAGLDAALVRLGGVAPVSSVTLGSVHGILMIYGFLGTAICLERAVAIGRDAGTGASRNSQHQLGRGRLWAYAAPLLSGLAGAVTIILASFPAVERALVQLPIPRYLGVHLGGFQAARLLPGLLWTGALAMLVAIYVHVWRKRQKSSAVLIQGLGAVIGLVGVLLWDRGLEIPAMMPWWLMFLVVTIIGERLELARLGFLSGSTEQRITTEVCLLIFALILSLVVPIYGYPLLGITLGVLAADVAWHDVARKTIRIPGVPRFAAAAMLMGYAWAMVPTILWVIHPPVFDGYAYDAIVHAVTIGFILSMVMAHAPVIIPAVARRDVPYHPVMWIPLVFLEVGLLLRLLAGAREADGLWRLGGSLSVVAVLVFVASTLTLTILGARRNKAEKTRSATTGVTP
ncbi:hypothetical protein [Schaalia sp. ZJ1691]|uniref:hypothetical protein n=1 Tax=Schaalia sp. ZJ1691 TaxID=2709404 RepID=UPI001F150838|nr:hypothetical protein [Schaalia sp. ZJ1691]